MIISFNPKIFTITDEDILDVIVKIFGLILEDRHLIDTRSISILFNDESTVLFNMMSLRDREKLKKHLLKSSGSITQLHKLHLTHFTIGLEKGEIHPIAAYRIIVERSQIIVENGINDGKFLRGICEKYTNHKKRGNLYQLIKRAINNEWIESTGGGIGEIEKVVEKWINSARYKDTHQYKIMTIFDSDRKAHDDFEVNPKALIKFLKGKEKNYKITFADCNYEPSDLIIWHILYKRKLENYVPISVIFNSISTLTDIQKENLNKLPPSTLDFHEYNSDNIGLGKDKIKDQFPEMFLTPFSVNELENRCSHHKVSVVFPNGTGEEISEMEQILLKIAKII
jgi:hypothetical protein